MLFRAHRVALAKFRDENAVDAVELGDSVGLVQLDRDDHALDSQRQREQLCALGDLVRLFDHQTVVAGQIRLALRAVDDQRVDGGLGRQLDRCREARAAHADDAGFAHALAHAVGCDLLERHERDLAVFAVVFDDDAVRLSAAGQGTALDRDHLAAHARKDVCAHRAVRLGDQCAALDGVAHRDDGLCRLADVLRQRDRDRIGRGDIAYRTACAQALLVVDVHSATEEFGFDLHDLPPLSVLSTVVLSTPAPKFCASAGSSLR